MFFSLSSCKFDFIGGNTSGVTVQSQNFEFNKPTPLEVPSGGGESPITYLYRTQLYPLILNFFSSMQNDRLKFLFELGDKLDSYTARILLLRPDVAIELKNPSQLNYVISMLEKGKLPITRGLAALVLSYSEDSISIRSLIKALEDDTTEQKVSGAAVEALGKIGQKAVPQLIYTLKNIENHLSNLPSNTSKKSGTPYSQLYFRQKDIFRVFWNPIAMPNECAIEPLISFLSYSEKSNVRYTAKVLKRRTGMDYGTDQKKWSEWWIKKKKTIEPRSGMWFEEQNNPHFYKLNNECEIDEFVENNFNRFYEFVNR